MPTAKKSAAKKSSVKKSAAKRAVASKKTLAQPSANKSAAKKSASKDASTTRAKARKYDPSVGERVGRELHEMHRGKLKSGSGETVTNPKQAVAIALSEKRREGAKVPPNPNTGK